MRAQRRLLEDQSAAAPCQADSDHGTVTLAELAGEFQVTPRALRFYEARGFLTPVRTAGALRRYSQNDRKTVALILQAKRLGFTLREIRELCGSENHSGSLQLSRRQCTEQINLLEQQKRAIETALTELRQLYSRYYFDALSRGDFAAD
jgi:DNA-binding transcriptional MerR regulator